MENSTRNTGPGTTSLNPPGQKPLSEIEKAMADQESALHKLKQNILDLEGRVFSILSQESVEVAPPTGGSQVNPKSARLITIIDEHNSFITNLTAKIQSIKARLQV